MSSAQNCYLSGNCLGLEEGEKWIGVTNVVKKGRHLVTFLL